MTLAQPGGRLATMQLDSRSRSWMAPTHERSERVLLDAALSELESAPAGAPSGPAVQELVAYLMPVVHARATRVLLAHGRGRAMSNLRATVEEYVQLVMGKVFTDRAHVLRLWSEDGGLSLKNWVGRFATLRCRDQVRSGKRDPWRHEATPPEHFARMAVGSNAVAVEAADFWQTVRSTVLEGQTEQGREMFRLLFEEDRSTEEIREATGLSSDAVFQWRRRLRVTIRKAWQAHVSEGAS